MAKPGVTFRWVQGKGNSLYMLMVLALANYFCS